MSLEGYRLHLTIMIPCFTLTKKRTNNSDIMNVEYVNFKECVVRAEMYSEQVSLI